MKINIILISAVALLVLCAYLINGTPKEKEAAKMNKGIHLNPLSPEERAVIIDKDTERPFTGEYNNNFKPGIYTCRQCGAPLYRSDDKFRSSCGWPAFEDEFKGAVKKTLDADGRRMEITCAKCGGHLGHVFYGEELTPLDTRHCVNSISMKFEPVDSPNIQRAIFAGGCFWGVEYHLQKAPGVILVTSGFCGGKKDYPTYREVCTGKTGHAEAVEVIYDPKKTSFEKLAKLFLEIHDPTQVDRQGPDIGNQYRSGIFYLDAKQRETAEKLIKILRSKGLKIATKVEQAGRFRPAEDYHQDYYKRKGSTPYCHAYTKRF